MTHKKEEIVKTTCGRISMKHDRLKTLNDYS